MSGAAQGMDRRQFLRVTAAGGAAVVLSTALGAPRARAADRLRVYVLVVDGTRPEEITPLLTPNLHRLKTGGTWFPSARSLPVMETIPNHVMMMTGVRPDRSGVPANSVFDRTEGVVRDLDRPTDLRFPTLLERVNATGRTTGTVLSKEYLYGIFGERATYRWEPFPVLPVTGHAPDAATTDALIAMVDEADPDLVFVNLGDIDRVGHSDLTGSTLRVARTLALSGTDLQVGRFVRHLQRTGRWASSVLVVLADHSMDWSVPTNLVSVDAVLRPRPDLRQAVQIAQNGGADLLYWTGPAAQRAAGLAEVRRLVAGHPGVLSVHRPAELRLGREAGDLVAYCRAGWRFTDPTPLSNPIPGNHGHPATEPIPFLLSGGHPLVRTGAVSGAPARTVDVAPTVGALFGLGAPRGGYDGAARTEAFTRLPGRR
ncbi:alkaline phosphatase family protein [Blastococcus sp. SYSU DS1024]